MRTMRCSVQSLPEKENRAVCKQVVGVFKAAAKFQGRGDLAATELLVYVIEATQKVCNDKGK
jgi:hypothetical protein